MKKLKLAGVGLLIVAMAGGLIWWWEHGKIYPSTQDAFLKAEVLAIAPQIGGRVATVAVSENQAVAAGQVLFEIDTAPLQAAVDAAQAQVDLADQATEAARSAVTAAQAQLASAQAVLDQAQTAYERSEKLFKAGDSAQAALDQAATARDQAKAAVSAAAANLKAARDQAGPDKGLTATQRAAQAQLTLARLNLAHATVSAPADGWIANLSLRPGQVVAPDQALFSLVENTNWWIDANFKETDLHRIRPGQPVQISIDMYPGTVLHGKVASLGAGSGAVFSLLPPENASGNWVKVTQRFPVRISLDAKPADPALQLRVGASVSATVDTSALGAN